MIECRVAVEDADIRLDRWFKRHFPNIPHALLQKALRKGWVRLDGKKAQASYRVLAWQTITLPDEMQSENAESKTRNAEKKKTVSEQDARMLQKLVLYKDAHVIVLNKPAGLAVQGGTKQEKNIDGMLEALRFDAKERPKLVHRLDKDTSGALVLARSAKDAATLTRAFAGKEVKKIYWALVVGAPITAQGKIDMPLAKLAKGKNSRMEKVDVDEDEGKRAVTLYRVVEALGNKLAWVELMPVTGRTHQLRVHMAAIGHPIVGDGKYGGRDAFIKGMEFSNMLHLHARRVVIQKQAFEISVDVSAPLPAHMRESWIKLGLEGA